MNLFKKENISLPYMDTGLPFPIKKKKKVNLKINSLKIKQS